MMADIMAKKAIYINFVNSWLLIRAVVVDIHAVIIDLSYD